MKHSHRLHISAFAALSVITGACPVLAQGPLTPSGPPAPIMKTLDQIEPRIPISSAPMTITQPGSYYLTTNLTETVVISSDDVTLDLMGFSIVSVTGNAIQRTGSPLNLVIRNGVLSAPQNGIDLGVSPSNANGTIEDLRIYGCTAYGIAVASGYRIRNCRITGVGAAGIRVDGNSEVRDCTLTGNAIGLQVNGTDAYVTGNIVQDNGSNYSLVPGNQLNLLLSQLPESIDWPAKVTLTGSLIGKSGSAGITINASDVTLDLNGFALTGVPGSLQGINVPQARENLEIRNGTVRYWGYDGVNAENAENTIVRSLRVYRNGWEEGQGDGLSVGNNSLVVDCVAEANQTAGFRVGNGNILRGCTASDNGRNGYDLSADNTIDGCSARNNNVIGINATHGNTVSRCTAVDNLTGISVDEGNTVSECSANSNLLDGIVANSGNTVSECSVRLNAGDGIFVGAGCTVSDSTAYGNTGDGFESGINSQVRGCTSTSNSINGIVLGTGGSIHGSVASDNILVGILTGAAGSVIDSTCQGNGGHGIQVAGASTVQRCVLRSNDGNGITATDTAHILDCTLNNNGLDAILAAGKSTIKNNACDFHPSGSGIHVTSSENTIEANSVTRNLIGLDVDVGGNLIIRNSARGNSTANYDIVAGNTVGPTVTSGTIAGSSNPHANYEF